LNYRGDLPESGLPFSGAALAEARARCNAARM